MTHTHLSFNVCKLGEHERPVEGQLCHIVVIQARTEGLEKEDTHTHTVIIDKLLWYEQKKKHSECPAVGKIIYFRVVTVAVIFSGPCRTTLTRIIFL